jgi:hypothetical protein
MEPGSVGGRVVSGHYRAFVLVLSFAAVACHRDRHESAPADSDAGRAPPLRPSASASVPPLPPCWFDLKSPFPEGWRSVRLPNSQTMFRTPSGTFEESCAAVKVSSPGGETATVGFCPPVIDTPDGLDAAILAQDRGLKDGRRVTRDIGDRLVSGRYVLGDNDTLSGHAIVCVRRRGAPSIRIAFSGLRRVTVGELLLAAARSPLVSGPSGCVSPSPVSHEWWFHPGCCYDHDGARDLAAFLGEYDPGWREPDAASRRLPHHVLEDVGAGGFRPSFEPWCRYTPKLDASDGAWSLERDPGGNGNHLKVAMTGSPGVAFTISEIADQALCGDAAQLSALPAALRGAKVRSEPYSLRDRWGRVWVMARDEGPTSWAASICPTGMGSSSPRVVWATALALPTAAALDALGTFLRIRLAPVACDDPQDPSCRKCAEIMEDQRRVQDGDVLP